MLEEHNVDGWYKAKRRFCQLMRSLLASSGPSTTASATFINCSGINIIFLADPLNYKHWNANRPARRGIITHSGQLQSVVKRLKEYNHMSAYTAANKPIEQ